MYMGKMIEESYDNALTGGHFDMASVYVKGVRAMKGNLNTSEMAGLARERLLDCVDEVMTDR